jgi:hypothetical protein
LDEQNSQRKIRLLGAPEAHEKMEWCRRWDSNPRPRDYETLALPLSYTGKQSILDATVSVRKVSSRYQTPTFNGRRKLIFPGRNVVVSNWHGSPK